MKIEIGKKYRDEMGRVYVIEKAPEGGAFPLIARREPSRVGFSLTGDGEALGISGRVFMLVEEVAE